MAITAFTDIIALAEAKTYLRIDASQAETDEEITSMINAAFRFIEKQTNHISFAQDVVYDVDTCIRIYDYPINSVVAPASSDDYSVEVKSTFSNYSLSATTLTLNVGYSLDGSYPDDLRQAALQMLKVWYFESEKQANSTLIPISVKDVIDSYRRFIL